jgi:endonuclease/exonuclease/phosphatase family metal-dependent hydrolase
MREIILEIVFIVLTVVFAVSGYGLHPLGPYSYHLTKRNPNSLRIVTWNVGGAGGHAGRSLDDELLPHIASVLKELDADLILLQEVANSRQAHRLSRMLDGQWKVIVSYEGSRSLAILGQRGRLSTQAGPIERHRALVASYQSPGKPPVLLMNIHADPYSAKRRNVLIGRATDVLMNHPPDHLKILAGDLNLDIDIGKRSDLFSDDDYLDVETYNYIAQRLSDVTLNTGSTAEPDRRLDYIFADAKIMKVIHSGPWKGKRVADMDHDPVVADLQFERNQ